MNINLGNNNITVKVVYKNNRNLYFRFDENAVLIVTCPKLVRDDEIVRLIKKNEESLLKMYNTALEKQKYSNEFWYLGKKYSVVYEEGKTTPEFDGDFVYIESDELLDIFVKDNTLKIFNDEIAICKKCFNNLPDFKELETALKNRLGIIIMNTIKHIPKNEQIRNLDQLIINEEESIEWLIHNSLMSAKRIIGDKSYKPNWDLTYMDTDDLNEVLVKYSQPIRYFIEKGFIYISDKTNFDWENTSNNDSFITNDDMNKFLNKASELEKVQIKERTKRGNVKPKVICGFINDVYGITNYKQKSKWIGKAVKGYYNLFPTDYYHNIMNYEGSE